MYRIVLLLGLLICTCPCARGQFLPDLELDPTVGFERTLDAGQSFTITSRVVNSSVFADVPPFLVDYYLVPPPAITGNPGDFGAFLPAQSHFLGRLLTSAFPSSQQAQPPGHLAISGSFNLPVNLEELSYRIGVTLDAENDVPELVYQPSPNERFNNFLLDDSDSVTVTYVRDRPDYTRSINHTTFSPTTSPAGELVTFSGRVVNITSFPADQITNIQHFLDRDAAGPAPTHLIGTSIIAPVPPNNGITFNETFRLPPDLPPGDYHYSFVIDAADVIPERDEHNNNGNSSFDFTLEVAPPVLPDLTAAPNPGSFGPGSIEVDGSFFLTANIANNGFSPAAPFDLRVRLSANSAIGDSDDITLVTLASPAPLAPGSTQQFATSVFLPRDVPPGSYRVHWIIDPADDLEEIDETNNTHVISPGMLTINAPGAGGLPDLRFSSLRSPKTAAQGQTLTGMDVSLVNDGGRDARASTGSFRLTIDTIVGNGDDILLSTLPLPAIDAGEEVRVALAPALPADDTLLPNGTYFFAFTADTGGAIGESDETNNTTVFSSQPITVAPADPADSPDLGIDQRSAGPLNAAAGSTISHLVTVANKGGSSAGVTTLFVLSTDPVLGDRDDIVLDTYGPTTFGRDGSTTYSGDISLPEDLPPGTYWLGWIVDPFDTVPETESGNNTASVMLHIGEFTPRLEIIEPKLEATVLSLTRSEAGRAYRIEYSTTLDGWQLIGPSLPGDPDHAILFELPPIPVATDAVFFRAVSL